MKWLWEDFLKTFQVPSLRCPIDYLCSFYANYSWENIKASAPTMRWSKFNWRAEVIVSVVIGSDTEKEKLIEHIEFGSSTVVYWKISFLAQIFFSFFFVSNKVHNNILIRNCRRFAVAIIDAKLYVSFDFRRLYFRNYLRNETVINSNINNFIIFTKVRIEWIWWKISILHLTCDNKDKVQSTKKERETE